MKKDADIKMACDAIDSLVPSRRIIPIEDILFPISYAMSPISTPPEYCDGVVCSCGVVIRFKNRTPHEPVVVICPFCKSAITYG